MLFFNDSIASREVFYPNADETQPVQGLAEGYRYVPIYYEAVPNPDAAYYTKTIQEGLGNDAELGEFYGIREVIVKRPVEEIKRTAEGARNLATAAHIDPIRFQDLTARVLFSLLKKLKGIEWTAKEKAELDKFVEIGQKLWGNDDVFKQKIAAIEAGSVVDLQAGYDAAAATPAP